MIFSALKTGDWINWQIDYLLLLQHFRSLTHGIFDSSILFITSLSESFFQLMIICLIYWCINNKNGLFLMLSLAYVGIFNQILKMTFCIYRPWVLDSKVQPPCGAIEHSGGYSFPSGHTSRGVILFGGIASFLNNKFVKAGLVLIILLIAFSRNYLGVHTPQDVIVGLLVGVFTLIFVSKILNWVEKGKNRDILLFCLEILLLAVFFAYLQLKSYPVDYLCGKILVEPCNMKLDAFPTIGYALGMFSGVFLANRFVQFDASRGSVIQKALRFLLGIILLQVLMNPIKEYLIDIFGVIYGKSLNSFLIGIFITVLYPLIFRWFNKEQKRD